MFEYPECLNIKFVTRQGLSASVGSRCVTFGNSSVQFQTAARNELHFIKPLSSPSAGGWNSQQEKLGGLWCCVDLTDPHRTAPQSSERDTGSSTFNCGRVPHCCHPPAKWAGCRLHCTTGFSKSAAFRSHLSWKFLKAKAMLFSPLKIYNKLQDLCPSQQLLKKRVSRELRTG